MKEEVGIKGMMTALSSSQDILLLHIDMKDIKEAATDL